MEGIVRINELRRNCQYLRSNMMINTFLPTQHVYKVRRVRQKRRVYFIRTRSLDVVTLESVIIYDLKMNQSTVPAWIYSLSVPDNLQGTDSE